MRRKIFAGYVEGQEPINIHIQITGLEKCDHIPSLFMLNANRKNVAVLMPHYQISNALPL
jgi:hypothetical protein